MPVTECSDAVPQVPKLSTRRHLTERQRPFSRATPATNGSTAVTQYLVYKTGTLLITLATTLSYTATGLTKGTTYEFSVEAENSTGTGSVITSYTVTSSPGSKTCATFALSCTVTGLTNGTAYTFTVVAHNAVGASPASTPSTAVTPEPTVPAKPGKPTATAATKSATVTWTAPTTGGSAITKYVVTSNTGHHSCTWTSGALSCTVTGLTNGTKYTFTVVAHNAVGTSLASTPSNSVTPEP